MIWIVTTSESGWTVVTVDGELVGDDVQEVERCCEDASSHDCPIRLFLRDVPHIDERGRMLLSRLAAKGAELRGSGLYISYIVEEIRREAGAVHGGRKISRSFSSEHPDLTARQTNTEEP